MSRTKGKKNIDQNTIKEIEELSPNLTPKEIADKLNINIQTVHKYAKDQKTKPKDPKSIRVWFTKKTIELLNSKNYSGLSQEQLAILMKINDLIDSFWQATMRKKESKKN